MKKIIVILTFLIVAFKINAQTRFNPKIDKDSLFESITKFYPDNDSKVELKKDFYSTNEDGKEYLISVLYESNYDKNSLIQNYEKNKKNFSEMKSFYSKIVPENYIVQVSFNNSKIFIPKNTISIIIYRFKDGFDSETFINDKSNLELISNDFALIYGSKKLSNILKLLNWNEKTLKKIENDLQRLNCLSVRNGNPYLFQYKKVGLGVLSYKIFNKSLTDSEKLENNDGCNSIYYKNNVVLISDNGQDGAKGTLCFPN